MTSKANFFTKMSESNILEQYSVYLQRTLLMLDHEPPGKFKAIGKAILSYEEFREYYIQELVGRDDFLDSLARKMQQLH